MSADRFAAKPGDGDFAQHLCIARRDAGKIHDLAQSDDIGPAHRLRDFAGPKTCPGILKSRSTRHTARAFDPYIDRQAHCLVMHELDARETEHIGDLMRIDEHARRALRNDGSGKLGNRHHATLDMHVPIDQARHHVSAKRF